MAQVYYEVYAQEGEVDLKEFGLESFSFEQSLKKDNLLTLQFKNVQDDFIDKGIIDKGKVISFVFGIREGSQEENVSSGKRIAVISDVKRSYQGGINNITVIAKDKGMMLKKVRSNKVWSGTTQSIVSSIAKQFDMKAVIDDTSLSHESLPQGNKTYYDFLVWLSKIEKDGDFECYINDDTLYFVKRKLERKAKVSYNRKDTEGKFKSLVINVKESKNDGKSDHVKVETINNAKGKTNKIEKSSNNVDNNVRTQKYRVNFDARGNMLSKVPQEEKVSAGKVYPSPSDKEDVARNFANHQIKKAQMENVVATLELALEPKIEIGQVITLEGLPLLDIGNYQVVGVKHSISKGSSGTTVELNRNAVGKGKEAKKSKDKVNTTVGESKLNNKQSPNRVSFDAKGNRIDK